MLIERAYRCTWRPCSGELGDVLGGHDRVGLDMHWEAEIGLNSVMHLEALIVRGLRCTWRP